MSDFQINEAKRWMRNNARDGENKGDFVNRCNKKTKVATNLCWRALYGLLEDGNLQEDYGRIVVQSTPSASVWELICAGKLSEAAELNKKERRKRWLMKL